MLKVVQIKVLPLTFGESKAVRKWLRSDDPKAAPQRTRFMRKAHPVPLLGSSEKNTQYLVLIAHINLASPPKTMRNYLSGAPVQL
jgi:hypothetical protein